MQSVTRVAHDDVRLHARSSDPRDRLIVALDVSSADAALTLANMLDGRCRWLKIGMELFYAEGRDLVRRLQDRGFCIFLDLKLHDIPNTAAAAVRSVTSLGVQLLTLHASGGAAMMQAAAAEADQLPDAPVLAAVTVLTSMDEGQLHAISVERTPQQQVLTLAALALQSGIRGLITSPLELPALRQGFGAAPILIVPGVRPATTAADDQRRTATPERAMRDGASFLVIGRPITKVEDPAMATEAILQQMAAGLR